MGNNIYEDGSYYKNCPSWDIEHSPWKAQQIIKILNKNNLNPKKICDVGCGAGEVLNQLYHNYSKEASYIGYDISPQAIELCKLRKNDNISYFLADICEDDSVYYDLILILDVIEHIEDLFSFLRNIRTKGTYKIFHIPLDLFALNIIKGSYLSRGISHPGHIHFFTKDVALEILKKNKYIILDYFYTPHFKIPKKNILNILKTIPRNIVYSLHSEMGIRIFGGCSLIVLTK